MEKFHIVTGIAACMPRENIDTGAMIPARYLRSVSENLGRGLFGDWRYDAQGQEVADFVLNREPFTNSRFIVAGDNFACGSSREAAVWALCQFGVRAVISSSFGEIFYENAFKNGLLPIVIPKTELGVLMNALTHAKDPSITVDLDACVIRHATGPDISFAVSAGRRNALLEGLDEIGMTLKYRGDIDAFREVDRHERPWIYARTPSNP